MARILALDLSLTRTGLCRVYPQEKVRTSSLAAPSSVPAGIGRLLWFFQQLDAIAETERPTLVVIENYAMQAKFRPYARAELGGVARAVFAKRRATILLVPPKTAKLFATGKGDADKALVLTTIGPILGIETIKNTDEGDAAALAYFGKKWLTPSGLSHAQHKSLGKCEIWRPDPIVARQRTRLSMSAS